MYIVTIATIIALELLIATFAFILRVIPLKNYHKNIAKVQIALLGIASLLGAFVCIYIMTTSNPSMFDESRWDIELAGTFFFLYFILFAGSVYRYFSEKNIRNNKEKIFELKATEYKIIKYTDLMLGNYAFMPNVKSYCEFEGGRILFTQNMPAKEKDCAFTCIRIKKGIYECVSYELLSGEKEGNSFEIIKRILFFVAAIEACLFVIYISQLSIVDINIVGRLAGGIGLILFGAATLGLLRGARGILSMLLRLLSYALILTGIINLFM
ncbi:MULTISPECIES: hypothetical protein [unclassified Butyrivibrio]|uniref:hypothetical protein n=1 Tax=unclassified Butyrivibrio TaxID=2639466 RepID=UPI000479A099|nr:MULTISPECIES: hypothetical protein [unclassified Butyrivibrio]